MSVSESSKQQSLTAEFIYKILDQVKDPEIPVISIRDLGVLQQVSIESDNCEGDEGDRVIIGIIPTYSGCPAMHVIKSDIQSILSNHGIENVEVRLLDDPIWTTDMITAKGRAAMQVYGIAPPLNPGEKTITCPQCGSDKTSCISEFGSTACKALYRCENCLEPFDYFKCHA